MKNLLPALLFCCFFGSTLNAQTPVVPRVVDFTTAVEGNALRFTSILPSLMQKAGAKPAFWTCHWEFGDGNFSNEDNPAHVYAQSGNYMAVLSATPHYDDGKVPDKKEKGVMALLGGGTMSGVFKNVFSEPGQSIALRAIREPVPQEEMICVISYQHNSRLTTDGQLHLFYNEKSFQNTHFTLLKARTHFGETNVSGLTMVEPATNAPREFDPEGLASNLSTTGESAHFLFSPPPSTAAELLSQAHTKYRTENVWRFNNLMTGEQRNVFISMLSTANMVKDTNTTIHLTAVFEPFDPAVPAQEYTLEIEIVSSHDPNAIAVSDNRVNYRFIKSKDLNYTVRFQNNGQGPASTVQLNVEVPEGLNMGKMKPIDWYPKCPICPKEITTRSCLDTLTTKAGLVFTFRNIYLPGSSQEGVNDRDSTKGFVKYKIVPHKDMPKRAFRSRAKIVFDKNPPIYTNFSKTRFKPGLSPGPKFGYAFAPDSLNEGYFFVGVSLSPFKSWKIYPQVELLTGIQGRTELAEKIISTSFTQMTIDMPGQPPYRSTIFDTTLQKDNRGFISFEVPFLLRKNFTRFFGAGIGAAARVTLFNGERTTIKRGIEIRSFQGTVDPPVEITEKYPYNYPLETETISGNTTRFSVFADLTVGSVRAGPNLGIRAGGILHDGFQPFVQVSLEIKL